MKFNKVTIIGIGLLGGSLARDLAKHGIAKTVVGVCRSEQTAKLALQANVVNEISPLADAVIGADLIVLATPMQTMLPILQEVNHLIAETTIITDVGSVKNALYQQVKDNFPDLLKQFIFAHPIAGGEESGVQASKLGLFENKNVVLTETEEVSARYVELIRDLWTTIGAKVVTMSLLEHDTIFAKTSHLPHLIAFSLVNFLNDQADRDRLFDMAAAGFYDFTRIASSDAQMWRDICITNRNQILEALDGYSEQLSDFRNHVANSDQQGIHDYFHSAKTARDVGLDKKSSKQ